MAEPATLAVVGEAPSAFTGPDRREYREIPVIAFTEWDRVGQVRSILRELEQGQFARASLLSVLQERDDRISGCWTIRIDTLLGTPLEFEPAEIDGAVTEETQQIADAAEVDWPKMFPEGSLDRVFKNGRDLGLGLGELITDEDTETGRWVPRCKPWHTQWVWWNWATDSFWLNTSGAFDENGAPVLDGSGTIELPRVERDVYSDGHWLIYCPGGFRYAFQRGLIRATAMLHLKRQWDMRDSARYNEVYGLLLRKAITPAGASEPDKNRFATSVRNMGSEPTIECPTDAQGAAFDVKIEGASGGDGNNTFFNSLHYVDECIGNVLLGQQASGEKKSSLGNGDENQNESVRQDVLEKDARLYDVLKLQVLSWWTLWNFGDRRLCPTPHAMVEPTESEAHAAASLLAQGQAASAIKAAFPNADMDALADEMGIQLLAEGEMPDVPPTGAGDDKPAAYTVRALTAKPRRPPRYVDKLATNARDAAARAMQPDLRAIKALIAESKSPDDLRERLLTHYRGMDPRKLADVVEKAMVLAELDGRHEVLDGIGDAPVARMALKGPAFEEDKHPRADDGKFASGGEGGSHAAKSDADEEEDEAPAEKHKANYTPAKTATTPQKTVKSEDGKEKKVGGASPGSQLPEKVRERLKSLGVTKLPAAHIGEVHVSDDLHGADDIVHGHALIKWKDDKGRPQSSYTPEFDRRNAEEKFKRVLENRPKIEAAIPELREKAQTSPAHAAALLIAQTGLRPGSDASVRHEGHYGATTMEARHVTFDHEGAHIEYVGKEGVTNRAHITDHALVEALRKNTDGKAPTDPVFAKSVRAGVADALPPGVKVKDLRTTIATTQAEQHLAAITPELTGDAKKDLKTVLSAIKDVSTKVSATLNNTPAMARKSYIAPHVIAAWGKRHDVPEEWLR